MESLIRLMTVCVLVLFAHGDGDHCRTLFDDYNTDHQSGLNRAEFKSIFIPTFDNEFPADGRLSRDEVVTGWHSGHCDIQDTRDGLLIFLETDVDRDLFVTDTDLNQIFDEFDSDSNGNISPTEFARAWDARYGRHTLHSVDHHYHHD
ncbi:uncharacterized protein LOC125664330 [Ostrea edulis]|uniref:uncharacterized protein LOC125664330 n=1 Tax=Ostrea edulis TaxID=37623 RepID=UPI002095162E|nr:uncharacterized protein LOC125664330 [Ostrea edulis]